MKRKRLTRLLAVVLSAVLCLQMSELSIFAASAGSFDPTSQINLTVPEALQDGNNYFFIREAGFSISEKSTDQLYIPVQRTGNTGEAADVTLKIIDMSARYGVNYKASLYDDRQKPEAVYEGTNVRDLFEHAEEQDEVEAMDENDLGEIIQTAGGAELVTPEGDTVGTINAVPLMKTEIRSRRSRTGKARLQTPVQRTFRLEKPLQMGLIRFQQKMRFRKMPGRR